MESILRSDVRQKFTNQKWAELAGSVFIDVLGSISYIVPVLGETFDIVIAPCSALAIYAIHRTKLGAGIGFLEEILPFTDFVPTATTIWVKRYVTNEDKTYTEFETKIRKNHYIIDRKLS